MRSARVDSNTGDSAERRRGGPRIKAGHKDVIGTEFLAHGERQAGNERLAGAERREIRLRLKPSCSRHIEQVTGATSFHVRSGPVTQVRDSKRRYVNHLPHFLPGFIRVLAGNSETGIVNQDVDGRFQVFQPVNNCLAAAWVREVRRDHLNVPAPGASKAASGSR